MKKKEKRMLNPDYFRLFSVAIVTLCCSPLQSPGGTGSFGCTASPSLVSEIRFQRTFLLYQKDVKHLLSKIPGLFHHSFPASATSVNSVIIHPAVQGWFWFQQWPLHRHIGSLLSGLVLISTPTTIFMAN